ncbi:NAD-dependent epimerase/dehydratase family protein [Rhodococcus hoagii]|nr:NAD-dependent epimerase/dehydratase family protein [Prescottella equi]
MRVCVTGVAGFIGSSIARRLAEEGHEVVGIDCLTDYYDVQLKKSNLAAIKDVNFTYSDFDLAEGDLGSVLNGCNAIIHQAGQPGVRSSWGSQFDDYTRNNIIATQRLLEHAKSVGTIEKFVYASSSSVYGNATSYPTTEEDLPRPLSPYGVSKLAAEHLCTLYAENFGVPAISLRYFTVYGPRQRPDMAFTRFCRAALTGSKITIYGDGEQVRDFTYIDDIVEANVLSLESDYPAGSVVNLSGGTNISVNDVLLKLSAIAGRQLDVDRIGAVDGDVRRTGGLADRAREVLGWAPKVGLEDGLERQFGWASDVISKGVRLDG